MSAAVQRALAAALLVALVIGALWPRALPLSPLPPARGGVLVLLVRGAPPPDLERRPGGALLPARDWDSALATGTRKPASGAARLGPVLRAAGVRTIALGSAAARWLEVAPTVERPETLVGPGTLVAAQVDRWEAPRTGATVLLLSAAPTGRFAALELPATPRGMRPTSPSTRRPGLIAATDLPATIAALCGVDARIGDGRPMELTPDASDALVSRAAGWRRADSLLPMRWLAPWALALLLALGIWRRPAALAAAPTLSLALVAIPAIVQGPLLVYGLALAVAAATAAWGSLRMLLPIAWASVAMCVLDTALGGPLQAASPLSYGLAEGSRFFGVGNEVAGIWLGAALVVALRGDVWAGGLLLLGAAVGMGAPTLGADAGGGLSSLIALAALCVQAAPRGRRVPVALALAAVAALLVGGILQFEVGRSESGRTHIGVAAEAGRRGGIGALAGIAERKLGVNARLLVTSPWAVLLAVGTLGALRRRRDAGAALWAGGAAALALNDSGVMMAALIAVGAPGALRLPAPREARDGESTDDART